MSGDGPIVSGKGFEQGIQITGVLGEELLGLLTWGVIFSVPIPINENGVGGALDPRSVLGSGWYVRARAFPERFGDARAGGDGDEMSVVGRSRKGECEVGFVDLGGGAEVAGEDAVTVGEEFQLVGLDPGGPQDPGVNFHFLVRPSIDIPGAIPIIQLHVNQ